MHLLHGVQKTSLHSPFTAGRELALCLHFVLLCSPVGQARGKQKRASRFLIQDPSRVRAAQSPLLGRTASQGHSTAHGTAGSRDADPLASPQAGSLKTWAPHRPGMEGPCSCGFTTSQLFSLVSGWPRPSAPPGGALRKSVERSVHCGPRGTCRQVRSLAQGRQPVVQRGQR